jgi:hypothetical protein
VPSTKPKQAGPESKTSAQPKPSGLEAFLGSNPFLSLSIWAHIAVIFYLLQNPDLFTPDIPETPAHEIAREYTRESRQRAMRERVDDMEAVKKMVDSLSRTEESRTQEESSSDSNSTASSCSEPPSESMQAPESMQALLARSEQLLQEIRAASDEVLQEKLSALAEKNETETETEKNINKEEISDDLNGAPEVASAENSAEALSDEELVQAVSKNQLEARELLSKMMRSEAAKQQGNSSELQAQGDSENSGGNGSGGQGLDPNNPLAVEHYFSGIAQGSVQDVSQAMKWLGSRQTSEPYTIDDGEKKPLNAPHINQRQKLVFSRKLAASGEKAEWVVLNAWYFIGPFPNPGRANIHTRFPPEMSIDLNAIYIGDSNRLLNWQYIQFDHLPVIPPDFTDYAVYYAYTEVFSEHAQDLWLAIGSDDQSKLWVNDMLVWQSTDHERVWSLAQGHRKVHLQQGHNKFLFRLENGIQRAAFSVSLTPATE